MLMTSPPPMADVAFARTVTEAVQYGVAAMPWLVLAAFVVVLAAAIIDAA